MKFALVNATYADEIENIVNKPKFGIKEFLFQKELHDI